MRFLSRPKGIAVVTVIIFTLLTVIIAGAALSIMTKQARLAEQQIRRVRAFYAAESAINKAYQSLKYMDTSIPPAGQAGNAGGGEGWTLNANGLWQWVWDDTPAGTGFEWIVDVNGAAVEQGRSITIFYNPSGAIIDNVPANGGLQARVDYGIF